MASDPHPGPDGASGYPVLDDGAPSTVPSGPVCPGAGLAAIVVGGLGLAVAAPFIVTTIYCVAVILLPSTGGEWEGFGRALAAIVGVVSGALGLAAGQLGWSYVQIGRQLRAGTLTSVDKAMSLFVRTEVLVVVAGIFIALVGGAAGLALLPVLALFAWPHLRLRQELAATSSPPPGTYPA